jgi:hypothetical protein
MSKEQGVLVETPRMTQPDADSRHLHISLDQVYGVRYDHKGPLGCVRKIVITALGPFVYLRQAGRWHPTEFKRGDC